MERDQTSQDFEEVYPQYEFAPLVQIALRLAKSIKRFEVGTAAKNRPARKEVDRNPTGHSHAH